MTTSNVKPVPDGYHTLTPYLTVTGVAKLIEFLKQAFGATETYRMSRPDGSVGHAELKIGDSPVMLGEASEKWKARPSNLYMYVPDVDAAYRRAMDAGGISQMEPADQFYGDRNAGVEDPSGNYWWIGTHVEDVSPEELNRRGAELAKKQAAS
jgi:PhnB protein